MNLTYLINESVRSILPKCRLGIVSCEVKPMESSSELLAKINQVEDDFKKKLSITPEGKLDVIAETRHAYKICGKEPSRYRPSAEALLRRVRQGKGLYKINNIVDTINLLSMSSQFSIGGFDIGKIEGNVNLDIGDSEVYQAIGRGALNIEFMPGLRDELGFFGTPTSDSERTMVTADIKYLVLVYYDFLGNSSLDKSLSSAQELLELYCNAGEVMTQIIV